MNKISEIDGDHLNYENGKTGIRKDLINEFNKVSSDP
jgi:hypothetical protein